MEKLSEKTHWDFIHTLEHEELLGQAPAKRAFKRAVKKFLGPSVLAKMSTYSEHLLWNVIFPKYFHSLEGANIVEIGSAPGTFLVQFSKKYGCVPHGVEYSEVGVEVNRSVFRQHGFDVNNVIHADFFSDELQDRYREHFDVVFSRGFIEHFADMQPVIDRHLKLLKPGGILFIDIPHFRGINRPLAHFFDKGALPRHNIEIMRMPVFKQIFDRPDLERLNCSHYGTFSFYLFTSDRSKLSQNTLKMCHRIQPLLNLAFRTVLGDRSFDSGLFSPFLLYVGRKRRDESCRS